MNRRTFLQAVVSFFAALFGRKLLPLAPVPDGFRRLAMPYFLEPGVPIGLKIVAEPYLQSTLRGNREFRRLTAAVEEKSGPQRSDRRRLLRHQGALMTLSISPATALGLLGAGAVVLGLAISIDCTPGSGGTPCPQAPPSDVCILPAVARDLAGGMTWPTTLTDVSQSCGATQDAVGGAWSVHTQAETIEGFVPKAIPGGDR